MFPSSSITKLDDPRKKHPSQAVTYSAIMNFFIRHRIALSKMIIIRINDFLF